MGRNPRRLFPQMTPDHRINNLVNLLMHLIIQETEKDRALTHQELVTSLALTIGNLNNLKVVQDKLTEPKN